MNQKLGVVIALGAGLLGGLFTRYLAPPPAFAQDRAAITKEIRAQSFTLTDANDRAVGTFTSEPVQLANHQPAAAIRIVLRDSDGREVWSAGGSAIRQLSQR